VDLFLVMVLVAGGASSSSSSRSCQMVVHAAHFLGSPRGEKAQLFRAYLKTELNKVA